MLGETMFDTTHNLVWGAIFGFIFGFLLRKAHVSRFHVIVGQLLLRDFTVMKVIFTAIIVGGIGVYFMLDFNMIASLELSRTSLAAVGLGGLIFGVGMAILGYCPGTSVAALGDGSRHAVYGIVGMITGIAIYAEAYPWIKSKLVLDESQPITLHNLSGLPVWAIFCLLIIAAGLFFYWLEKSKIERPLEK